MDTKLFICVVFCLVLFKINCSSLKNSAETGVVDALGISTDHTGVEKPTEVDSQQPLGHRNKRFFHLQWYVLALMKLWHKRKMSKFSRPVTKKNVSKEEIAQTTPLMDWGVEVKEPSTTWQPPHKYAPVVPSETSTANSRFCGKNFVDGVNGRSYGVSPIVHGEDSYSGKWPWMTAIFVKGVSGKLKYWCGATIINSNTLVSAAHCFHNRNPSRYKVYIGVYDVLTLNEDENVSEFQIESITIHPNYKIGIFHNDIAVIKLEELIIYNRNIFPICLPERTLSDDLIGANVSIIGWGNVKFGGQSSNILQEASVPIISNKECSRRFKELPTYDHLFPGGVTKEYVCADFGEKNQDSCQGDSGGPMMRFNKEWEIVGIISFGIGCSEPGFAGVYTRVSQYTDWISGLL